MTAVKALSFHRSETFSSPLHPRQYLPKIQLKKKQRRILLEDTNTQSLAAHRPSAWPELLTDANLRFAGYAIDWQVNMRGNILGCQLALCSHTLRCWLQINKQMSGNMYIHPVAILPTLFTCPYHTCPNILNVQLQSWYHTFLNYPVAKEVLEMAMKKEITLGTMPFVCVSSFGREFTLQPWYKTINNEDYALCYLDCSILE